MGLCVWGEGGESECVIVRDSEGEGGGYRQAPHHACAAHVSLRILNSQILNQKSIPVAGAIHKVKFQDIKTTPFGSHSTVLF